MKLRVIAKNYIHSFKRVTDPDKLGPFPIQKAEQYIGKYLMYHLQEAPEKRSNFLNVPSNRLCLWVWCLLSDLFLLGDMYEYGPGSDALKSLSGHLVPTEEIYTPEMLWWIGRQQKWFLSALELGVGLGNGFPWSYGWAAWAGKLR